MIPGRSRGGQQRAKRRHGLYPSASVLLPASPRGQWATSTKGADLSHTVLQWFAIIAPLTTFATALSFWFGWTLTTTRTAYFGIDQSILEYSSVDFILRSADALIVPAISILIVSIFCLGLHALTAGIIRRYIGIRYVRLAAWTLLLTGASVTFLGVWTMFGEPFDTPFLFEPAALGGGVALSAYAFWIIRRLASSADRRLKHLPMWEKLGYVSVVLLVIVALFWACSLYAAALGTGRSREYARDLYKRPSVTVYSVQSLAMEGSVKEEAITQPDAKYRFKYTGLKFVTMSANKYFLLPANWSRNSGAAIVLDDSPECRVEFTPGG